MYLVPITCIDLSTWTYADNTGLTPRRSRRTRKPSQQERTRRNQRSQRQSPVKQRKRRRRKRRKSQRTYVSLFISSSLSFSWGDDRQS